MESWYQNVGVLRIRKVLSGMEINPICRKRMGLASEEGFVSNMNITIHKHFLQIRVSESRNLTCEKLSCVQKIHHNELAKPPQQAHKPNPPTPLCSLLIFLWSLLKAFSLGPRLLTHRLLLLQLLLLPIPPFRLLGQPGDVLRARRHVNTAPEPNHQTLILRIQNSGKKSSQNIFFVNLDFVPPLAQFLRYLDDNRSVERLSDCFRRSDGIHFRQEIREYRLRFGVGPTAGAGPREVLDDRRFGLVVALHRDSPVVGRALDQRLFGDVSEGFLPIVWVIDWGMFFEENGKDLTPWRSILKSLKWLIAKPWTHLTISSSSISSKKVSSSFMAISAIGGWKKGIKICSKRVGKRSAL